MAEEFFNQDGLNASPNAFRYAVLFAQDCEPTAIYSGSDDQPTETFTALALAIGQDIEARRQQAEVEGRDFYAAAFAEQAAQFFNRYPIADYERCMEAGQQESDTLAR